jgi:hypothetical protein
MVNRFPFLRYIPSWLPGAGFKSYAAAIKKVMNEQQEAPFKYATDSLVRILCVS